MIVIIPSSNECPWRRRQYITTNPW